MERLPKAAARITLFQGFFLGFCFSQYPDFCLFGETKELIEFVWNSVEDLVQTVSSPITVPNMLPSISVLWVPLEPFLVTSLGDWFCLSRFF